MLNQFQPGGGGGTAITELAKGGDGMRELVALLSEQLARAANEDPQLLARLQQARRTRRREGAGVGDVAGFSDIQAAHVNSQPGGPAARASAMQGPVLSNRRNLQRSLGHDPDAPTTSAMVAGETVDDYSGRLDRDRDARQQKIAANRAKFQNVPSARGQGSGYVGADRGMPDPMDELREEIARQRTQQILAEIGQY